MVRDGRSVVFVDADGSPTVRAKFVPETLPANERARRERVDADIVEVSARLGTLRADAHEVDVIGALLVAARAARTGSGTPTVLVIDSGLQTVPPLDFSQPGVLGADPGEVAEFLRQAAALPDLSGVAVLLAGIGSTASPQQPLTDAQSIHLRAIYRAVLETAGASCISFLNTVPDRAPTGSPFPVTLVSAPATPAFAATPTVLDSNTLRFLPESEQFVNPDAARAVLAPVVAALRADPGMRLQITGTTATGIPGHGRDRIELSTARAESVRQVLLDEGIAADRLIARGVGTDFAEFVPDITADGVLLPGPAARNRSVRLQPIS
ncbi:OmpA family protein [Nocardia sp. NPDC058705]|uniref:OmpA family protein n=1 Tax=Nocardia sp. NPDC058705 TaxID=3346609 RepID=UPI0036A673DA